MRYYGKQIHPIVYKIVSGISFWAQIITYDRDGILIWEYDPCSAIRTDDAAMAYHLFGVGGLPEGFHFLPTTWVGTLKDTEDLNRAVQMRSFGKVKYE